MSAALELIKEGGKGRAFILLFDEDRYADRALELAQQLEGRSKVKVLRFGRITDGNWEDRYRSLESFLKSTPVAPSSSRPWFAPAR